MVTRSSYVLALPEPKLEAAAYAVYTARKGKEAALKVAKALNGFKASEQARIMCRAQRLENDPHALANAEKARASAPKRKAKNDQPPF